MNRKDFCDYIKNRRILLDGGTGTYLNKLGMKPGTKPELMNLEEPETVEKLHLAYFTAGADIAVTNTFGVNCEKYENYAQIIENAVKCCKNARKTYESVHKNGCQKFISLDIGPTGRMMKPYGDMDFDSAYEIFSKTVAAGAAAGADLISIETFSDINEVRAAVLAAKDNCDLPVFATMVFGADGKTFTGTSVEAAVAILEGLGVSALGLNCSLGPAEAEKLTDRFVRAASVPVIIKPNAGLPDAVTGGYTMDAGTFASYMRKIAEKGANILGGCCGTDPEYIKTLSEVTSGMTLKAPDAKRSTVIASANEAVIFYRKPVLIGERINPTGKPKLKAAIKENNTDYIINEAIREAEAGADVLDVNMGVPGINEAAVLSEAVSAIQAVCSSPLQIDTSDPAALEKALRTYSGKALINSVNGKKESLEAVLPLAVRYGGVVVGLTLDENGIPETAEERLSVALRIRDAARKAGIKDEDLIIDPLAMAVSSDINSAKVTLDAITLLKDNGFKTVLGVSNISFGLPSRPVINAHFFSAALDRGLSAAIMNPFSEEMMDSYRVHNLLHGLDEACSDYISYISGKIPAETAKPAEKPQIKSSEKVIIPENDSLFENIYKGIKDSSEKAALEALKENEPLSIISKSIIPALEAAGKGFSEGTIFLPRLMLCAEAGVAAFSVLKDALKASAKDSSETASCPFVIATVKGDIHDIGKNIVKVMLESYGFDVCDLGRDVPPEALIEALKRTGARLVGLSALMTTTLPAMAETVRAIKDYDKNVKIIVGGAVLTEEYAASIGADKYAKDAMDTVTYARQFSSQADPS